MVFLEQKKLKSMSIFVRTAGIFIVTLCSVSIVPNSYSASALHQCDIRSAQAQLNSRGHSVGKVDGKWGPASARALFKFQARASIKSSGVLDQATCRALDLALKVSDGPNRQMRSIKNGTSITLSKADWRVALGPVLVSDKFESSIANKHTLIYVIPYEIYRGNEPYASPVSPLEPEIRNRDGIDPRLPTVISYSRSLDKEYVKLLVPKKFRNHGFQLTLILKTENSKLEFQPINLR